MSSGLPALASPSPSAAALWGVNQGWKIFSLLLYLASTFLKIFKKKIHECLTLFQCFLCAFHKLVAVEAISLTGYSINKDTPALHFFPGIGKPLRPVIYHTHSLEFLLILLFSGQRYFSTSLSLPKCRSVWGRLKPGSPVCVAGTQAPGHHLLLPKVCVIAGAGVRGGAERPKRDPETGVLTQSLVSQECQEGARVKLLTAPPFACFCSLEEGDLPGGFMTVWSLTFIS